MVEHLTKDLGVTKIAIMYQDDAFGQAGLAGVKRALDKRQMQLAGEGTFERNTVAVKTALLAIKKAEPQAVIMISPYKPAAEFIKLAKQIKLDATFVNISFVGSDALAKELGAAGAGVVITQVVPFPKDAAIPVVGRYQAALKATSPDAQPGFVSLEGYLVGRAIIAALEKVDGEPTRAGSDRGRAKGRHARSRRLQAQLQPHQQPRIGSGVPDRDSAGRQLQGGRSPREVRIVTLKRPRAPGQTPVLAARSCNSWYYGEIDDEDRDVVVPPWPSWPIVHGLRRRRSPHGAGERQRDHLL